MATNHTAVDLICTLISVHFAVTITICFCLLSQDKRDAILEEAKSLVDAQEDPK